MKKRSFILVVLLMFCTMLCLVGCGEPGEKGEKGDTGAQGIQGIEGAKGEKGDTGAQGPKGDAGAAGENGAKGDTGPQGPQGPAGKDGENGKDVEFDVTDKGIFWRLKGEETWKSLLSFEDLFGYSQTYTITFDADGGDAVESKTNLIYKSTVTLPAATQEGYEFAGWFDGTTLVDNEYVVKKNVTLTAQWAAEAEFVVNGGYTNPINAGAVEDAILSFNTTKFNTGTDGLSVNIGGYEGTTAVGGWWHRIYLKFDATKNAYEIVGLSASGQAAYDGTWNYVVGVWDQHSNTALRTLIEDLVKDSNNLGKYVVFNKPLPAPKAAAATIDYTVYIYEEADLAKLSADFTEIVTDATFPVIVRPGYTFKGWFQDESFTKPAGNLADYEFEQDQTVRKYYAQWEEITD